MNVQSSYQSYATDSTLGNLAYTVPQSTTTTLSIPSSQTVVKETTFAYDSLSYTYNGTNYTASAGKLMTQNEYAFGLGGVGALTRKTAFSYLDDSNPTYKTYNIVDRVTDVLVQNASSSQVADTKIAYDSTSLVSVSAPVDWTNPGTFRGNPTQIQTWVSGSTYLSTSVAYDLTGQVSSVTDPAGNTASFSYADKFYADNGSNPPQTYTPAGPTNSLLTQITLPVVGSATFGYYYGSSQQAWTKDLNGNTTYFHFRDALNRPTLTSFPDGGYTSVQYITQTQVNRAMGLTSTTARNDSLYLDQFAGIDMTESGQGTVYTWFDSNHRVKSVTTPYITGSEPTYGVETVSYDGLDRTATITRADGSLAKVYYGASVSSTGGLASQLCASTFGLGYPILTVDEAGSKRQSWTDAFGRIIEVDEPNSSGSLAVSTCYAYDLNDNLTQVSQSGQTRTFTYDGLSRLTQATEPESGTKSYSYTASGGTLCAGDPSAPCAATDARGITATNTYDALSRVTLTTYSDGTPLKKYYYDQSGWGGVWTLANGVGRLSVGETAGTGEVFGYDPMGRVILNGQTGPVTPNGTPSGVHEVNYTYDLLGDMTSMTNGAGEGYGQTITYSNDSLGRPVSISSSLVDSQHPATLVSLITYWPTNQIQQINYGNGLTQTNVYNNRLQPCRMNLNSSATVLQTCAAAIPTGNLLDLNLGFHWGTSDNGNVVSFAGAGRQSFSRTYSYDPLNRLIGMSSPGDFSGCYGLSWGYDLWGNRTSQTTTSGTCYNFSETVNGNNQLSGPPYQPYQYDAAGNLTNDGVHTYYYDAEGRLNTVDGGSTATYWYTVEGWRGSETTAAGTRDFVHDRSGNVLNDITSNSTNGWQNVYIGLGGQTIGQYTGGPSGTTYFAHQDHIGSTRLLTTLGAGVQDSLDFLPFGEQMVGGSTTNQKFTGYDRDTETGLDHSWFRYYGSTMGRWLSPDPIRGSAANPQSWNAYSYVKNNPSTLVDPFGLDDDGIDFTAVLVYNEDFYDTSLGEAYSWLFTSMSGFTPLTYAIYPNGASPIYLCAPNCGKPQTAPKGITSPGKPNTSYEAEFVYKPTVPFAPAASVIANSVSGYLHNLKASFKTQPLNSNDSSIDWSKVPIVRGEIPIGPAEIELEGGLASAYREAEEVYPKLAGKTWQLHHLIPKYLGGAEDGVRSRIPAAYHQLITNAFRELAPYGQRIKPTAEALADIMKQVYTQFPLPPK
jgi:RHS repeat-associated protein